MTQAGKIRQACLPFQPHWVSGLILREAEHPGCFGGQGDSTRFCILWALAQTLVPELILAPHCHHCMFTLLILLLSTCSFSESSVTLPSKQQQAVHSKWCLCMAYILHLSIRSWMGYTLSSPLAPRAAWLEHLITLSIPLLMYNYRFLLEVPAKRTCP